MASNSVQSIYDSYMALTAEQGNTLGNDDGVKSITYSDGELLFEENDGDKISVAAENVSDDVLDSLKEKFGIQIGGADNASKTGETEEAKASKTSKLNEKKDELALNQAEKSAKESEMKTLTSKSDKIKEVVEQLSGEIEQSISEAVKKQQKLTEEEEKRVQNIIEQEIKQYKTDKEAGKPVTLDTLNAKIQSQMNDSGFDTEMQVIVGNLVLTNSKINQMETLLDELGTVSERINELDGEITDLDDKISGLEDEIKQEEASTKRHDPIGFEADGKKYEFVVDRDNSNDLTNISEFLGAEDNFNEMIALDMDESGNVDKEELKSAGVKILVTDTQTGEQTLKDIDEVFTDGLSVNLKSYNDLSGQNVQNEDGQTVLGNFEVQLGEDQTIEGYSTLDTDEYLLNNYTFSGENQTAETATADSNEVTKSIEEFLSEYRAKVDEYKEEFDNLLASYEFSTELIDCIKENGLMTAKLEADEILNKIDEENKAEEAEEAEEADDENAAPQTTDDEAETAQVQDAAEDTAEDDVAEHKEELEEEIEDELDENNN